MKRPRDSQRSKVYAAENKAFPHMHDERMTLAGCKSFVSIVVNCQFWKESKGRKIVKIKDGRGTRRAMYYPKTNKINLPKWARNEWVIIHELAHFLCWQKHEDTVPSHGVKFCGIYLKLVEQVLGAEAAVDLAVSFEMRGVKYEWDKKHVIDNAVQYVIDQKQNRAAA